ncbi:MAG: hypothetical protein J6W07_01570 [Bacteroidales bacterium]|nr:hypothetical protein [Bacteroidales bacterium]
MKKIITVLIGLVMLGAPLVRAQQFNDGPVNDINISYGYFTAGQFITVFGGVLGAAFSLGHAAPTDIRSTGSIQVEYLRKTNYWLWLGGGVSGERDTLVMEGRDSDGNATGNPTKTDINTMNVFATAKANWLRREKLALYSRLSAGVFVGFGEDPSLAPSVQLGLIGFEAGNLNSRGFLELGIGMHGVISCGFRHLF